MRILHFSDFHLQADQLKRSETILKRMMEAVMPLHQERPIDLIVFSGDLIDKAGANFAAPKMQVGFQTFNEMVIDKMTGLLNLPPSRFVFVPGNHDVDQSAESEDEENKVYDGLKSPGNIDWYMHQSDADAKIPRIAEYNRFKEYYWKNNLGTAVMQSSPFQTNIKQEIGGKMVGVTCLNTAWRCFNSKTDIGRIVMGKSQITSSRDFLEDCHIRIAVGHHHPSQMNDIEKQELMQVIVRNYDAYCCGHTHGVDGEMVSRPEGSTFFFTAPGSLCANISEQGHYRNGFMVIDYEQDERFVETRCYYQDANENFVIDLNYGRKGVWHQNIPGSSIIKPMAVSLFLQKHDTGFIPCDRLREIMGQLANENLTTIHLVALSGLGKTRLLKEVFNDKSNRPNRYYCEYSDSKVGLLYDIEDILSSHRGQDGIIVLDNCPNELLERAIAKRDLYNPKFKIIGVNNEYYDRKNITAPNLIQIDYTQNDLRQTVDEYIDRQIPAANGNTTDRDNIKKIADGFPGMATVMVKEYLAENNVDIHKVDHVVAKMLTLEEGEEKNQEIVLRSLALFQPFPYKDEYREAYRYIRESERITPLYKMSNEEKRHLFHHTISRYDNSLVEITECWLNVRPFPLAIWLVGRWFDDDDDEERMAGIVEEIQGLDKPLYTVVRDGLAKRLEYMKDSAAAFDLLDRLMNGPFANEKVVCSDLGSRLFLAMSSVNPVAVATCLHRVLMPKAIDWIRVHVAGTVRRNLVWALEKLCFAKDSYPLASQVMALLAVAENETWGNNATGQFGQLFHVMLPGTEADLTAREQTLGWLMMRGEEYKRLTLDAFNQAFASGSFIRDGEGSQFGLERRRDYTPKPIEIVGYWEWCREELVRWIDRDPSVTEEIAKIASDHAFRWNFDGVLPRMMPLMNKIAALKGWQWEEMYTALNRIGKKHRRASTKEFAEQLDDFINSIRPNSFCQKLKDVRYKLFDEWDKGNDQERMEHERQVFTPIAADFLQREIYLSEDEVRLIVDDQEYHDFWFSRCLYEQMNDKQLEGLYDTLLRIIPKDGGNEFRSSFFFYFTYTFRDKEQTERFFSNVYEAGYRDLYVRLVSQSETDDLKHYHLLMDKMRNGELGEDTPSKYLTFVSPPTNQQTVELIKQFYRDFPDQTEPLLDFVIRHQFNSAMMDDEGIQAIVRQLLLDYTINPDNGRMNSEYTRYVVRLLEKQHDDAFAAALNRKLINDFNGLYLHSDFEGIYSILLRDYTDVIWDDFETAFNDQGHIAFVLQVKDEIGSGASFAAGPLFQIGEERIKEMCRKYPDTAPYRVAEMAPVFHSEGGKEVRFSDMILWCLDEYGDQKYVRDGVHANMNTFSWSGSVIPLLMDKRKCLEQIADHRRPEVREWVAICLREIDEDYKREHSREEYMRLHYQ